MIDSTLIIYMTVYLLIMFLVFWVVSKTGWWAKIFVILYIIAVLPNLIALSSGFTFDKLVMAWFDSLYLFILLPLYVLIQLIMRMGEKGWLGKWFIKKTHTLPLEPTLSSPEEQVEQTLINCVKELEKSDK